MDAIVITWRELLVAVILASLIYLLEAAIFSRRRHKPQTAPHTDGGHVAELTRLHEELSSLRQRLDAIESRLSAASDVLDDTPYGRAVRLAREGLTAQELASRCGISRGEAELIIALNRAET